MKLITIALTYLKQTFSSRSVLIFSFLMPLLFTVVLGVAMQGMGPDDAPRRWELLLSDEDHSPLSAALAQNLEADSALKVVRVPVDELPSRVDAGEAPAGVLIPMGFGAALLEGRAVEVTLYRSAERVMDAQLVEQSVQAALASVEGVLDTREIASHALQNLGLPLPAESLEEAARLWEAEAPLEVNAEPVTRLEGSEIPIGAAQSSPGMAVMYVLFLTIGGGVSLLMEREHGTLRRLLVMPVSKGALIGGKLLGIYLSALVQMTLMILFGRFALGVNWGQDAVALIIMLLAYAFAATALGVMVAALVRTPAQADGLSTITVMALSALGGAWWPIEIVPAWMQSLAQALPTYWGMQGFQDIIVRGLGVQAVLPEAAVLLAFGVAFLGVGLWRFRWE